MFDSCTYTNTEEIILVPSHALYITVSHYVETLQIGDSELQHSREDQLDTVEECCDKALKGIQDLL